MKGSDPVTITMSYNEWHEMLGLVEQSIREDRSGLIPAERDRLREYLRRMRQDAPQVDGLEHALRMKE